MKILTWVRLVCCIFFTGSALAFNSQISAGLLHQSISTESEPTNGPKTKGDRTVDEFFVGYTYFLTPVEDNGEPLDLLPFFSRSSYVYGNYFSGDYEWEADDFDYSSEKDWTGYGVGGVFYFMSYTAIGAGYFTQDGEWEDDDAYAGDTYDEDRDGWNVSVMHYLDDANRLSVRISETDRDRDAVNGYERSDTYQWIVLSYDGVLGDSSNFFLGVDIGQGSREKDDSSDNDLDHDLTRFSISAGPVYRSFSIYFSLDYYEWDPDGDGWEAGETYFTISPRYWFNEQLMLGGDIYTMAWDESYDSYDYDEDGTGVEIRVRYRF